MYYLPNCADVVNLPPPTLAQGWEKNPILYFHENPSSSVFKPLWWTLLFGWMSFIPKRPQFDGSLLGRLVCIPIQEVEGRYSMPEDLTNSWKKLEYLICNVITASGAKYKMPAIGPPYPSARGYQRQHAYWSVVEQEAWASRQIFVVWIGVVSYLIAGADTASDNDWPSLLLNELSFHPAIADLIRASDFGTFSHEVQHVGAFIYLSKQEIKNTNQPSVCWIIAHNIPIWYWWDKREIEQAKHDPVFAEFGPLLNDGLPESCSASANPLSSPSTRVETITWREFFQRYEEKCLPVNISYQDFGGVWPRAEKIWFLLNEWDCCLEFRRFRTPSPDNMEDNYMDIAPSADDYMEPCLLMNKLTIMLLISSLLINDA